MPRSVAPLFRALALTALIALPLALFGACATEDAVTSTCLYDITEAGITPGVDGGCTGFAICRDVAGNPAKASVCCKDANGKSLTGDALATCLFGYGEGPAPSTAAATSSGSSSSSSTGTGSGGADGGS